MKPAFSLYGQILRPWLCVGVYLWALEFQAVYGVDFEPLLDRLADCSAILWTLVFWIAIMCGILAAVSLPIKQLVFLRYNLWGAKGAGIVISAFYFVRWLFNWQLSYETVLLLLSLSCIALASSVVYQGKKNDSILHTPFVSLADCFSFVVFPILVGSALVLGFKIAISLAIHDTGNSSIAHAITPKERQHPKAPNVILIVSDALRAESMSLYGRQRDTTPSLNKFAESANVYLHMHTNSTSTKPSLTSLLSGQHPLSHGRLTKVQPPYRSAENLLRQLRDYGYDVAAVTSNEDASLNLLGFSEFLTHPERAAFEFLTLSWLRDMGIHPTPTGGRMYQNLAQILPLLGYPRRTSYYGFADDTLAQAKKVTLRLHEPFFLLIHLHEPHDPYDAAPPFRGMYGPPDEAQINLKLPSSYYARYGPELQPVVDSYKDKYDESIQYLDFELGKFLGSLYSKPWANNLLLIITADHGESFERGFFNHGENLYEHSTRVPLIIRFPGQSAGAKLAGLVDSTDIAATIINAAGIPVPPWMDGHALYLTKSPVRHESIALNYKDPVADTIYSLPTRLAIWSNDHKMIVFCDMGKRELFNLKDDPGEKVELSIKHPYIAQKLEKQLRLALRSRPAGRMIDCLK